MLDIIESTRTLTSAGFAARPPPLRMSCSRPSSRATTSRPTKFKTGLAELRAEMTRSEARLIRWVGGIMLTAAGIVTAAVAATGLAISCAPWQPDDRRAPTRYAATPAGGGGRARLCAIKLS